MKTETTIHRFVFANDVPTSLCVMLHMFDPPFFSELPFVCNLILCLLYSYNDDMMWPESGLQSHTYEHAHTERLRKLHYLRRLLDSIIYLLSFSFSCEHNHVYILPSWKWLLIVIKVEMNIHNGFLILPLTVILE